MKSTPRFGFVVEYVKDIEAARRFYVDVMGLKIERYHPTFIQFDTFAITSDEPLTGSGEPELYWLIDDAEATFGELSRITSVTLPLTQMPFGKMFGIEDPAGRPRYLLELARYRPSQPVA